jgi:hypothetical protein
MDAHVWTDRPPTVVAPELDLFEPGKKKKAIELDICVLRGNELWIGEAKTTASLGSSESDARNRMLRVRRAADALSADSVLLVSEVGFGSTAQAVIHEVFSADDRFEVRGRRFGRDAAARHGPAIVCASRAKRQLTARLPAVDGQRRAGLGCSRSHALNRPTSPNALRAS